jgi:hypothetical protein
MTIARVLALAVVIFAALPTAVESCFITTTNQLYLEKRPDSSWPEFLAGQLGVVQPSWNDRYLFVAYRTLSGVPFTNGERKKLAEYFSDREINVWLAREEAAEKILREEEARDPRTAWLKARQQFVKEVRPKPKSQYRTTLDELEYCGDDAFITATQTLHARAKSFAHREDLVVEWVKAQDDVFENCGPEQHETFPPPASVALPAVLKFDREYQLAAANFYSQSWDKAYEAFNRIAGERESQWQPWGKYLAARSLIRKDPVNQAGLEQSESILHEVVRTATDAKIKRAAVQLLGFVRFRLHPIEYQMELSASLMKPSDPETLVQRLIDYLAYVGPQSYLESTVIDEGTRKPRFLEEGGPGEWMRAISEEYRLSGEETLEKYAKYRSLPWLVAALMNAKGDEQDLDTALEAGAKVQSDSPAYLSLTYHGARLMRIRGRHAEARELTRSVLQRSDAAVSTKNLFKGLLVADAETLSEFLLNASATVAGSDTQGWEQRRGQTSEVRPLEEAAWILNHQLSLDVLSEALASGDLDPKVRKELAPMVFTRAVLLDRLEVALKAAPVVAELNPEMKPLMTMVADANGERGRQLALFAIARSPGMRPYINAADPRGPFGTKDLMDKDIYGDNWWCSKATRTWFSSTPPLDQTGIIKPGLKPSFVSERDQAAGEAELKALSGMPSAPSYVAPQVLKWANESPEDPLIPEALHRVVRMTRYGCADDDNSKYSKAAFMLLHKRYPQSEWTKKTPYYF